MKDLSQNAPSPIANALIIWYENNKRELPWRDTRDPYRIWISEIILQQTRVVQGYEYYLRFTERFPDVKSLAEAHEDEVMKYWEGLGYYSRARNLHTAAKMIMEQFGGVFPTTYPDVLSLKGIGEYTAAAICSFAYRLPHAVVDGNVFRVLARCFGIDTPIDSTNGKKEFFSLAQQLLDIKRPDIYNQAIMELGALQCTPRSPRCEDCPLVNKCMAYRSGLTDKLPVKAGKTTVKPRYFNYLQLSHKGKTWINKRSGNDIWKNLYEFILIETEADTPFEELIHTPAYQDILGECNDIVLQAQHPVMKHVLSHRIIHARFYTLSIDQIPPSLDKYICISQENISDFAFSRLTTLYLEKAKQI